MVFHEKFHCSVQCCKTYLNEDWLSRVPLQSTMLGGGFKRGLVSLVGRGLSQKGSIAVPNPGPGCGFKGGLVFLAECGLSRKFPLQSTMLACGFKRGLVSLVGRGLSRKVPLKCSMLQDAFNRGLVSLMERGLSRKVPLQSSMQFADLNGGWSLWWSVVFRERFHCSHQCSLRI